MRQILIGISKYKDIGYKGYEAVLPGDNIPAWCTCKSERCPCQDIPISLSCCFE